MSKPEESNIGTETIEKMVEMTTDELIAMSPAEITAYLLPAMEVLPAAGQQVSTGKKATGFKVLGKVHDLGASLPGGGGGGRKKKKKAKSALLSTLEAQSAKKLDGLSQADKDKVAADLRKEIGLE